MTAALDLLPDSLPSAVPDVGQKSAGARRSFGDGRPVLRAVALSVPRAVPRSGCSPSPRDGRQEDALPGATVRVLAAPAGRESMAPVRLTRRGVLVVALAVVLLGAGLCWAAAMSRSASAGSNAPGRAAALHTVTVRPGDTLWSIAAQAAPSADPRAEIAVLQRENGLRGAALQPGQTLRVP